MNSIPISIIAIISIISINVLISTGQEELLYSSTFQLKKLFENQRNVDVIGENFNHSRDCSQKFKELASDFIAEHPVAAYGFIKCLLHQWKSERLHERDLKGAALSLVRIQDVYDYEIDDILGGKIDEYESNVTLNVEDCIFIAHQAFFNLQLDAAERWLQHCAVRIDGAHLKQVEYLDQLSHYITAIRETISSNSQSTKILQLILKQFPEFSRAALTILTEKENVQVMKTTLNTNAKLLCLGLKPPWVRDLNLKCYLAKKNLYSYYPTKVEKIHRHPDIYVLHQMLNDDQIEILKSTASPKLETSKTHRFGDGMVEITSARIGQMAWIKPQNNQLVNSLYKKMEKITGLSTESAEGFQVLNYGLGGHYEVHMDFFDFNRKGGFLENGDRIATALFYLNDVKSGGATVFPELGIEVHPIKGSALFWRNLLPDGSGDYRTLHAACPVAAGNKWVANLWFHEKGQHTPVTATLP